MAIRGRQNNLKLLPKDDLLVFYGYDPDGSDAADLVQQFLDLGTEHDPANMRIMELGYDRWDELGYPFSAASG